MHFRQHETYTDDDHDAFELLGRENPQRIDFIARTDLTVFAPTFHTGPFIELNVSENSNKFALTDKTTLPTNDCCNRPNHAEQASATLFDPGHKSHAILISAQSFHIP